MWRYSTKFLIVDQLADGWVFSAHRTLRILSQLKLAKLHGPGIEQQQSIDHQVFSAKNDLYRLVGLDGADNTRQNTQYTSFRTRGNQTGRRGLGIQAAITSTAFGPENTGLPFKAEYGSVDIWLASQDTGIVHQVTSGKVIGAVNNDVVILEKTERVVTCQSCLVGLDLNMRIDISQAIPG